MEDLMEQDKESREIVVTPSAQLEVVTEPGHVGIREATEKRLVGFTEGDPTIRLMEKDIVTIKMFMRLASYEERTDDPGELLADMLECYVKRHYPHFELEYEESPKKRKRGTGTLPVEAAAAAAAASPPPNGVAAEQGEAEKEGGT
jgi:hypothetical protein